MVYRIEGEFDIDIGINFERWEHRTRANIWWSKVDFVEDHRTDGHWIGVLPTPKSSLIQDDP